MSDQFELDFDAKVKEADDIEIAEYNFSPTLLENGVIDYSEIQHDKIFLVNKKDILEKARPTWIPELDITGLLEDDFLPTTIKSSDGYYYVQTKKYVGMETNERTRVLEKKFETQIYKMSSDILAATVDYYIKKQRAENKKNGIKKTVSLPRRTKSMLTTRYNNMVELLRFIPEYKDNDELLRKYPNRSKSTAYKNQNTIIFNQYNELLSVLKGKTLDLNLAKQDFINAYAKGEITSYGDTGISNALYQDYGVKIKKQNGSTFSLEERSKLTDALDSVYNYYGNLSNLAKQYGLKISYADNCKQHARKAIGLFTNYHKAIGVSFFNDLNDESLTMAHETAHWLDSLKGKEFSYRMASDKDGTIENKIAEKYKKLIKEENERQKDSTKLGRQKDSTKLGDYWYRTCECFARAIEQDFGLTIGLKERCHPPAYLPEEIFNKEIKPLIEELKKENEIKLNLIPGKFVTWTTKNTIKEELKEQEKENMSDVFDNKIENNEEYANELADWIIQESLECSVNKENYHISFEDIVEKTNTPIEWLNKNYKLVNEALAKHNDNELLEYNPEESNENEFNLNFCSNATENDKNTLFKQNKQGRWVRKTEEELEQELKNNTKEIENTESIFDIKVTEIFDDVSKEFDEKNKDFFASYEEIKLKQLENVSKFISDAHVRMVFTNSHSNMLIIRVEELKEMVKRCPSLEIALAVGRKYFNYLGNPEENLSHLNLYTQTNIGHYENGQMVYPTQEELKSFISKLYENSKKQETYIWNHYEDGSCCLKAPNGEEYFVYDPDTGEVKITKDSNWIRIDELNLGDKTFTQYAEDYVLEKNPATYISFEKNEKTMEKGIYMNNFGVEDKENIEINTENQQAIKDSEFLRETYGNKKAVDSAVKKVSITDFCSKDENKHFLEGIFYENGFAIATNSNILIKQKTIYPEEYEGKIIDPKTGKEIEGQFPNYKKVFPKKENLIDRSDRLVNISNYLSSATTAVALTKKQKHSPVCVDFGGTYVAGDRLQLALAFAREKGFNKVYQEDNYTLKLKDVLDENGQNIYKYYLIHESVDDDTNLKYKYYSYEELPEEIKSLVTPIKDNLLEKAKVLGDVFISDKGDGNYWRFGKVEELVREVDNDISKPLNKTIEFDAPDGSSILIMPNNPDKSLEMHIDNNGILKNYEDDLNVKIMLLGKEEDFYKNMVRTLLSNEYKGADIDSLFKNNLEKANKAQNDISFPKDKKDCLLYAATLTYADAIGESFNKNNIIFEEGQSTASFEQFIFHMQVERFKEYVKKPAMLFLQNAEDFMQYVIDKAKNQKIIKEKENSLNLDGQTFAALEESIQIDNNVGKENNQEIILKEYLELHYPGFKSQLTDEDIHNMEYFSEFSIDNIEEIKFTKDFIYCNENQITFNDFLNKAINGIRKNINSNLDLGNKDTEVLNEQASVNRIEKVFNEMLIINETKPYSFFVKDTAEFEQFAEIKTKTNLSAKKAIEGYKSLRAMEYSAGIGIHIPTDTTFNDPKGLGTTILVRENGIDTFDIYGDSFIVDLKENNERSQNRIAAYKELYEEAKAQGLNVKEPTFLFEKERELGLLNEMKNDEKQKLYIITENQSLIEKQDYFLVTEESVAKEYSQKFTEELDSVWKKWQEENALYYGPGSESAPVPTGTNEPEKPLLTTYKIEEVDFDDERVKKLIESNNYREKDKELLTKLGLFETQQKEFSEVVSFDSFDNIPQYAVYYMTYGEDDSLSDDDKKLIDDFMKKNNLSTLVDTEDSPSFTNSPAFGLPCDCVKATFSLIDPQLKVQEKINSLKIEIPRVLNYFGSKYELFYDSYPADGQIIHNNNVYDKENVLKLENELVLLFDSQMKENEIFKTFVQNTAKERGDIFSSDRECAALLMSIKEVGLEKELGLEIPELKRNEIVTLLNQRKEFYKQLEELKEKEGPESDAIRITIENTIHEINSQIGRNLEKEKNNEVYQTAYEYYKNSISPIDYPRFDFKIKDIIEEKAYFINNFEKKGAVKRLIELKAEEDVINEIKGRLLENSITYKNVSEQKISNKNIKLNNITKDENGFYNADLFIPDENYIKDSSINNERFAMAVATWKDQETNINLYIVKRLISEPHNKEKEFLDVEFNGNPTIMSEQKWNLLREQETFDIIGEQIEHDFEIIASKEERADIYEKASKDNVEKYTHFSLQELKNINKELKNQYEQLEPNSRRAIEIDGKRWAVMQNYNRLIEKQNFIYDKLSQAGIEVVTDKEEFNRILEREELLQKMAKSKSEKYLNTDDVKFLNGINDKNTQNYITQDGTIYGFAHENKIYLNPDIVSSEAAIHEYTHLWDNYTKVTNPELWNKGKEVFKNTYLWEEVKNDEHYQDISHDEDLILSECHARITGKIADKILDKIQKENGELTKDTVIDWNKEVFEYISKEFTGKDIDIQSVSEFVSQTMKDFMDGRVMETLGKTMEQQSYKYYTKRPVDIGTVPKGFASFENYDYYKYNEEAGREVYGFVEYDRELSEEEIKEFELFKPNPYREFRIEPTKENGLKEPYILTGRRGSLQGTSLSNFEAYIQDARKVHDFNFLDSIEETIQFIENGFKRPENTSLTINIKDYEIVKTDNKSKELSSEDIKLINNFKNENNLNLLNNPSSVELVTDEIKSDEVAILFNYDIDKSKLNDLFVIDEHHNNLLSDKDNNVKLSFKVSSGSLSNIDIQCYKENKIYNLSFWSDVTDTARKELCNLLKEPFKSINNNIDFTQKGWNDEWHKIHLEQAELVNKKDNRNWILHEAPTGSLSKYISSDKVVDIDEFREFAASKLEGNAEDKTYFKQMWILGAKFCKEKGWDLPEISLSELLDEPGEKYNKDLIKIFADNEEFEQISNNKYVMEESEFNVVDKILTESKMYNSFFVLQIDNNDMFQDFDEEKIVSLKTGLSWLSDGLVEPTTDELSVEELSILKELLCKQNLFDKVDYINGLLKERSSEHPVSFSLRDITDEQLTELKEHLSNNGYDVQWKEKVQSSTSNSSWNNFTIDLENYPYIITILEDRNLDFEYLVGLTSFGYDAAWLNFEDQKNTKFVTETEFKKINELNEKEFKDSHRPYIKINYTESWAKNHKPTSIEKGTVLGFVEGIKLIDELNKKFNTSLKSDISFYMWDEKQNDYVEYDPGFEFHDNIRTLDNGKEIPYTQTPITEEIRMICSYPEILDLFEENWIKQFAPTITDEQKNFIKELTDASYTKLNERYNQGKETLRFIYDKYNEVHSSSIIEADVADATEQNLEIQQQAIARLFDKTLELFVTKIDLYLDENKDLLNKKEFLEYAKHKIFNVLQDVQFQESRNAKYGKNGYDFDFAFWNVTNEKILAAGDYNTEFEKILAIKEKSLQQTEEYAKEISNTFNSQNNEVTLQNLSDIPLMPKVTIETKTQIIKENIELPFSIINNVEKGRVNIKFNQKISDKKFNSILKELKSAGWKFSSFNKQWYPDGKAVEKSETFAKELQEKFSISEEKMTFAANTIKETEVRIQNTPYGNVRFFGRNYKELDEFVTYFNRNLDKFSKNVEKIDESIAETIFESLKIERSSAINVRSLRLGLDSADNLVLLDKEKSNTQTIVISLPELLSLAKSNLEKEKDEIDFKLAKFEKAENKEHYIKVFGNLFQNAKDKNTNLLSKMNLIYETYISESKSNPLKYEVLYPITKYGFKNKLKQIYEIDKHINNDILSVGKKLLSLATEDDKKEISEWLKNDMGCEDENSLKKLFTNWVSEKEVKQQKKKDGYPSRGE